MFHVFSFFWWFMLMPGNTQQGYGPVVQPDRTASRSVAAQFPLSGDWDPWLVNVPWSGTIGLPSRATVAGHSIEAAGAAMGEQ
jgi:hypothetical protein